MNVLWHRFLRSAYRKEPISSFVITIGTVDAVIGGVGSHYSLLAFGLGTVGVAIAFRLLQRQRQQRNQPVQVQAHYLPSRSPQPQLPTLTIPPRRNPPD